MLLPIFRQIEQKALVERSARSLRRAARVLPPGLATGFLRNLTRNLIGEIVVNRV